MPHIKASSSERGFISLLRMVIDDCGNIACMIDLSEQTSLGVWRIRQDRKVERGKIFQV